MDELAIKIQQLLKNDSVLRSYEVVLSDELATTGNSLLVKPPDSIVGRQATLWIMYLKDGWTELRLNGELPGYEVKVKHIDTDESSIVILRSILSGKCKRLSLPLYKTIKFEYDEKIWKGVNIDFDLPFGKTEYDPYPKSNITPIPPQPTPTPANTKN